MPMRASIFPFASMAPILNLSSFTIRSLLAFQTLRHPIRIGGIRPTDMATIQTGGGRGGRWGRWLATFQGCQAGLDGSQALAHHPPGHEPSEEPLNQARPQTT